MRLGTSVAACGFAVLLASFGGTALAQQPAAATPPAAKPPDVTPICANCHEDKHTSITFAAHGAKNDATGAIC